MKSKFVLPFGSTNPDNPGLKLFGDILAPSMVEGKKTACRTIGCIFDLRILQSFVQNFEYLRIYPDGDRFRAAQIS